MGLVTRFLLGLACSAALGGCKAPTDQGMSGAPPSTPASIAPRPSSTPEPESPAPVPLDGAAEKANPNQGTGGAAPLVPCAEPQALLVFPYGLAKQRGVMSELLAVASGFRATTAEPQAPGEIRLYSARFTPGGPYAPTGHPLSSTARHPVLARCADRESCERLARAARNVVGGKVPVLCALEEGLERGAPWSPLGPALDQPRGEAACARVHACLDAVGRRYWSCERFDARPLDRCAAERTCEAVAACIEAAPEKQEGAGWTPRTGPDLLPP